MTQESPVSGNIMTIIYLSLFRERGRNAWQLHRILDETDFLDSFQSGFRPGYGTDTALVTLMDDLQ